MPYTWASVNITSISKPISRKFLSIAPGSTTMEPLEKIVLNILEHSASSDHNQLDFKENTVVQCCILPTITYFWHVIFSGRDCSDEVVPMQWTSTVSPAWFRSRSFRHISPEIICLTFDFTITSWEYLAVERMSCDQYYWNATEMNKVRAGNPVVFSSRLHYPE